MLKSGGAKHGTDIDKFRKCCASLRSSAEEISRKIVETPADQVDMLEIKVRREAPRRITFQKPRPREAPVLISQSFDARMSHVHQSWPAGRIVALSQISTIEKDLKSAVENVRRRFIRSCVAPHRLEVFEAPQRARAKPTSKGVAKMSCGLYCSTTPYGPDAA